MQKSIRRAVSREILLRANAIEKADAIFDALGDCIHINIRDDETRQEVGNYLLHKMIWSLTCSNELANELLERIFDCEQAMPVEPKAPNDATF